MKRLVQIIKICLIKSLATLFYLRDLASSTALPVCSTTSLNITFYLCIQMLTFYISHSTDVDRLPLVSSAIIQVAQNVDEPWPVEVIGHDGKAYNITMEPGHMVLYESHTILHGRPYPLSGQFYVRTRT